MTFEGDDVVLWRDGVEADRQPRAQVSALEVLPSRKQHFEAVRRDHPNAWRAWTEPDNQRLEELAREGWSIARLAQEFGRRPNAIVSRLRKLELDDLVEISTDESATG